MNILFILAVILISVYPNHYIKKYKRLYSLECIMFVHFEVRKLLAKSSSQSDSSEWHFSCDV